MILGNRWLAEELSDLISEIPGYKVEAFVENLDPSRCGETVDGLPIIWIDELQKLASSHLAVCGIGTTERWRYAEQAEALGMRFATLAHPSARISQNAELGDGTFVSAGAVISTKTITGKHVFINRGVMVGHHVRLDDYVSLQCGANVAGLAEIGSRTYIGMSAVILDRVKIGRGCIVAAGSVVTKDAPDRVQLMGIPARIVKTDIEGL